MEILGIGPLEILFILIIALIVLGPGDMVKAGRTIGRFLRKVVTSSEWRTVQRASQELKYLPNKLMRDANLEDLEQEIKEVNKIGGQISSEVKKAEQDLTSWTTPPIPGKTQTSPPQAEKSAPDISSYPPDDELNVSKEEPSDKA